jgi:uncharacterized protein (DUF1697 family)
MRNEKLRAFFESLGFTNVQTVIASGNVLFEARSNNIKQLETKIENALPEKLGFNSATIVRSLEQLQEIVNNNPFGRVQDTPSSRLNVTFLKNTPKVQLRFPHREENGTFVLLGIFDGSIYSKIDLTSSKTPDLMAWLDRQFGKQITTRTWKTVGKIIKKLDAS